MKITLRRIFPCLLLPLAGCATPHQRETGAEARGYERGYRQAVQEQYWIIQNQQRATAPTPTAATDTPSQRP